MGIRFRRFSRRLGLLLARGIVAFQHGLDDPQCDGAAQRSEGTAAARARRRCSEFLTPSELVSGGEVTAHGTRRQFRRYRSDRSPNAATPTSSRYIPRP
jgi:hypothetical protein